MYEVRNPALLTGGNSPVLLRPMEITSYFPNKDTDCLTMAILHKRLQRTTAREALIARRAKKKKKEVK